MVTAFNDRETRSHENNAEYMAFIEAFVRNLDDPNSAVAGPMGFGEYLKPISMSSRRISHFCMPGNKPKLLTVLWLFAYEVNSKQTSKCMS